MTDKMAAAGHRLALVDLVVAHVRTNPGSTNAEVAVSLGLESSFEGGQRNYLSFTLLCDGVASGQLARTKDGRSIRYFSTDH